MSLVWQYDIHKVSDLMQCRAFMSTVVTVVTALTALTVLRGDALAFSY